LRDRRQSRFLKENQVDAFTLMDLYKGVVWWSDEP